MSICQTYYTVSLEKHNFVIYENKREKGNHSIHIIDANGSDCVRLDHSGLAESNEITLSGLGFKPICNLSNDLNAGAGTRLMIKSMLIFTMKYNPVYDMVLFKDDATFECHLDRNVSIKIHLNLHNFVCYGKTWYERYFGATPLEEDDFQKMDTSRQLLSNTFEGKSFNLFWSESISRIRSMSDEMFIAARESIESFYEKCQSEHATWQQLFYNLFAREQDAFIYSKFGQTFACILFLEMRKYIKDTFIKYGNHDLHMQITRATIESYPEFNETSIQQTTTPPRRKILATNRLNRPNLFKNNIDKYANSNNNSFEFEPMPWTNEMLDTMNEEEEMGGGCRKQRMQMKQRTRRSRKMIGTPELPTLAAWLLDKSSKSILKKRRNTRKYAH